MTPQQECGARVKTRTNASSGAQHKIKEHYSSLWTHTHLPWKRVCVELRGGRGGAARSAWRGSRLSLAVFHSLSPPGSRSCSQDCCSHQQTAVPLHLGSPRRQETVIPREFNAVSSRRRVPPSQKNRSSGSHHSPHPQGCESHSAKAARKIWKWQEAMLFHSLGSNCVAVTSALAPRARVRWRVWDSPVCGRRKPSVRLCLCNSSALSVSRAPLSPTCLTVKTIRVPVAGLLPHLWNYGNSSLR